MSLPKIALEQFQKLPVPLQPPSCAGKTYIVTGGNSGLGLETVRHLVRCAASRVILTSRDLAAGERAKADVERSFPASTTSTTTTVIQVWHLDLSSYASVRAFAARCAAELDRVDAVVQNAGVFLDRFDRSNNEGGNGMETSMTVNVMSAMLLAVLLVPKLSETARMGEGTGKGTGRTNMVFVGSALGFLVDKEMRRGGERDVLRTLDEEKTVDMLKRYDLTKCVQMYAVRELAAMLPAEKTGVVINITAPGICSTGLGKGGSLFTRIYLGSARLIARTPEEGSRTTLHGLVSGDESHGKFLSGGVIKEYWYPEWMTGPAGQRQQKQVWKEIVGILESVESGCVSRLENV